jgi:RND family efflux transporter MFP subunit
MKRKRHLKRNIAIILIVLGLIGLTVSLTVGGSEQDEALAQESQIATVQRGNLSIEITAAGNLALSRTEDLAVDLFYGQSGASGTKGTIGEVLVEEGDTVEEGQVLVTIDEDEWGDQLSTLEKALVTAQRNLTAKQSALVKAERQVIALEREVIAKEDDVTKAERQVAAKEFAVLQAQLNVETAEYDLSQIEEVKEAQDDVDDAELNLKIAQMGKSGDLAGLGNGYAYWTQLLNNAYQEKEDAEIELAEVLAGTSTTITSSEDAEAVLLEIAEKQLQVKQEQMELEDAQLDVEDSQKAVDDAKYALEDAQLDVEDAKQDVEDAKLDVEDTKQDVEDAQSDLDEAKSLSSVITAPFAGFVTQINVEGGDEVLTGTVAVQIADPNKFEADILVSEMDISQVELEGEALVQIDATGLSLPATVTHIAPTATIQSGVVNYSVTVEVQSIPEDAYLREGMTVTVSLVVEERQDVLLVPYAAITTEGEQKYVQVVSPDGTTEMRAIETGITDYQFTEVTEGLSEGEQVLVSRGTTSESTTTEQQQPGGMMPIPGMGGPQGPPPGG